MKQISAIPSKVFTLENLLKQVRAWRMSGKKIAFTNGVFDILHEGHIASLGQAASEADYLIVGVNSDASTKRLKGPTRPVNNENSRALLLACLVMVDAAIVFEDDTPLDLITNILPDVIVKGGDYTLEKIVGAKEIMANGGRVVINPILEGFSTTGIIAKMRDSNPNK